jgi:hypothetical protein
LGVARAFGVLVSHLPSAILILPKPVSRSPPETSSIYPSSIRRDLCPAGMRCIKPLAPSRNETNSSRVNGGDKLSAIPRICASGGSFSSPEGQPSGCIRTRRGESDRIDVHKNRLILRFKSAGTEESHSTDGLLLSIPWKKPPCVAVDAFCSETRATARSRRLSTPTNSERNTRFRVGRYGQIFPRPHCNNFGHINRGLRLCGFTFPWRH